MCKICGRPAEKRGWCGMHYRRWWRHGDPRKGARIAKYAKASTRPKCIACDQPSEYMGKCSAHMALKSPKKCFACGSKLFAAGYCSPCYNRLYIVGRLERTNAPPGTGYTEPRGYVNISRQGKRTRLHRWIMAKKLRRALGRFEFVHHINGDKSDNRLANLRLMPAGEHSRHHNAGICRNPRCRRHGPSRKRSAS